MTVRFATWIEAPTLRDAWLKLVEICEDIADEKVQPSAFQPTILEERHE